MELIGDIIKVLRHPAGIIRGAVVRVTLAESLELAIISSHWPEGLREGVRIFAKGHLMSESTGFKRATHFLAARTIEVIPRRGNIPA
jgi:hypothetical protein